jgi:unsaturated chondroitin disaccharide hydrolase
MKQLLLIIFPLFLICLFTPGCSPGKKAAGAGLQAQFDRQLKDAAMQYSVLKKALPPDRFPKTWDPRASAYEWSGSQWWCSGFYPGTLLYLFESTRDSSLLREANRMLALLSKEQFNRSTHDLGFMMFCSFGNALKISPSPEDTTILVNSARSLSTRFDPKVGCIRSWDSKNNDFLVIIDNMMNLELLFWATRATHDSSFYRIAVTHANTTMLNHFRSDNSSYHVVNYDQATGAVKEKRTAQGFSNESAWARGQAWGLYGFTVMYRETHDQKYLDQANRIAAFILKHPNLPADKIPYWDFNAPGIPNALRDASAGAIMCSALLELAGYVPSKLAKEYISDATTMLQTLSGPAYRATNGENGGFLIKHGVGHLPNKTEVDVPLTYGDYYFTEAMIRFKKTGIK